MPQYLQGFLPIIIMLGLFYLMIIIPENRRKKKYQALLDNLKVNDEVMTRGGIIGKVINIQDDFVIIQSGPDKSRFKLANNGISVVLKDNSTESTAN